MNRKIYNQFLGKISEFPSWMKDIIAKDLSQPCINDTVYIYTTYKPLLTYKGKCELNTKKSGFDKNIYNILELINQNLSLFEIALDTYLTLSEVSLYFLMCINAGFIENPTNISIRELAEFLSGKIQTGEYLTGKNLLTPEQLKMAIKLDQSEKQDRKFGEILTDLGFINKDYLENLFTFKEDSKKRFILDFNNIPKGNLQYSNIKDACAKEIEDLKTENKQLKSKLNQLLTLVKNYD